MRDLTHMEPYRVEIMGNRGDEQNGAFKRKMGKKVYNIICSNGGGWEHVSVSHHNTTPTWEIMQRVKGMFFDEHEVVMQLHPAKEEYVNMHEHCLHLWKPKDQDIPTPPKSMVGL